MALAVSLHLGRLIQDFPAARCSAYSLIHLLAGEGLDERKHTVPLVRLPLWAMARTLAASLLLIVVSHFHSSRGLSLPSGGSS